MNDQKEIGVQFKVEFVESPSNYKVGISENAMKGEMPIHALRHFPKDKTTGWHIWAGDYSDEKYFFKSMHVFHLKDVCPEIIKYLGLPPGYRFLIDDKGYEDIWFDATLLNDE